jgi:hypothetical protein
MALANSLAQAGFTATSVHSSAMSTWARTTRLLDQPDRVDRDGAVPNVDNATFQQHVEKTNVGCIIKRALAAVPTVTVKATLKN